MTNFQMPEHPIKSPRKLIEVALPLDAINAASAREKSIRHGHPSTLHLWWARRPLAAARAVIFAQLVNDPGYQQGQGFKYGVNKQEAANNSVFVAGWRPFIGWICGSALASDFMVRPLATWIATLSGHPIQYPSLDLSTLLTLLLGMLGLGAMRSYDKTNGTSNGH